MTLQNPVVLREATRADVPWLVEAERACFPDEAWTQGMVADEFERPGGVQWIAEVQQGEYNGERAIPVGFAFGWLVLGELHVLHIATLPARRRGGAGRALLRALIHTEGTEMCWLEVRQKHPLLCTSRHKKGCLSCNEMRVQMRLASLSRRPQISQQSMTFTQ